MSNYFSVVPIPTVKAAVERVQRRNRLKKLFKSQPLQHEIISRITTLYDQTVVNQIYALIGLRQIHDDAVKRLDSILDINVDLLLDNDTDALFANIELPADLDTNSAPSAPHFSPLNNRSPSPVIFPRRSPRKKVPKPYPTSRSPSIEQIFPKKSPRERRVVIDMTDEDHIIEVMPTIPFITRTTKYKAKTHDCTVCKTRGHDEVHCDEYMCDFCHDYAPGHLPSECLQFLAANEVPIPIPLATVKKPRPKCSSCGRWGHLWLDCRRYTCMYCKKDAPGHETFDCLSHPSASSPLKIR
jgi:hypothetical protein